MSKAEIERFSKDLKGDTSLQEGVKAAGTDESAIAGFARSKGYDFSADELKEYAEAKKGELSDEQLDKVAAGGTIIGTWVFVTD